MSSTRATKSDYGTTPANLTWVRSICPCPLPASRPAANYPACRPQRQTPTQASAHCTALLLVLIVSNLGGGCNLILCVASPYIPRAAFR